MDPPSRRSHSTGKEATHDFEDDLLSMLEGSQAHMSYPTTTAQGQAPSSTHIRTNVDPLELSNLPPPAWQDPTSEADGFLLDVDTQSWTDVNAWWLAQQHPQIHEPNQSSSYQDTQNINLPSFGRSRIISDPLIHHTIDPLFVKPESPSKSAPDVTSRHRHSTLASPIFPPSIPYKFMNADPGQEPPERKPRPSKNKESRLMPKKRDASTESLTITRRTADALEQAIKEAEGESGWGWKLKEAGQSGPTFGETLEIEPMYNENRTPVKARLHGRFDVSRVHAGLISCDEGPVVHELQKRNIFQIRNISYSLNSDADTADFLMLFLNGKWERINKMFVKLVGKKNFGDSPASSETPLETRGKARSFKPAQRVKVFEQMRYDKTIGGFTCRDANYGDGSSLSHIYAQSHIEFRHATSGNRTKGYWRVESQSYYRLALQLWAYVGANVREVDEFRDSRDLILVAESTTELLIVRGRPPGGREVASEKTATGGNVKTKTPEESAMPSRTKRQKREHTPDEDDDEAEWLDQPIEDPVPQHSLFEASRPDPPQSFQAALEEGHLARRYDTRQAPRRTYEEAMSDSNEQDTSPSAQHAQFSGLSEHDASSPHSGFSPQNKTPQSQFDHFTQPDNYARQTGSGGQKHRGGNAYREGQPYDSLSNMAYPASEEDDGSMLKTEDEQSFDWAKFDWHLKYDGPFLPEPSYQPPAPAPSPTSESVSSHQARNFRTVARPQSSQAATPTVAGPDWGFNSAAETARRLGRPPPVVVAEAVEQSNSNTDQSGSTSEETASPEERRQVKPEVSGDDVSMGCFADLIDDD